MYFQKRRNKHYHRLTFIFVGPPPPLLLRTNISLIVSHSSVSVVIQLRCCGHETKQTDCKMWSGVLSDRILFIILMISTFQNIIFSLMRRDLTISRYFSAFKNREIPQLISMKRQILTSPVTHYKVGMIQSVK